MWSALYIYIWKQVAQELWYCCGSICGCGCGCVCVSVCVCLSVLELSSISCHKWQWGGPHVDLSQQEAFCSVAPEEMWCPAPRTGFHLHRLRVPVWRSSLTKVRLKGWQTCRNSLVHHTWTEVLKRYLRYPEALCIVGLYTQPERHTQRCLGFARERLQFSFSDWVPPT